MRSARCALKKTPEHKNKGHSMYVKWRFELFFLVTDRSMFAHRALECLYLRDDPSSLFSASKHSQTTLNCQIDYINNENSSLICSEKIYIEEETIPCQNSFISIIRSKHHKILNLIFFRFLMIMRGDRSFD